MSEIEKAKADINLMWQTLTEARGLAREEFAQAQEHLRKVAEHNQTIYALMADIAQRMKDLEKLLIPETKTDEDTTAN